MSSADFLSSTGFILILVGIFTIILTMLLLAVSQVHHGNGHIRGGGIIMVGPLPIIFSSDPKTAKIMVCLAIILIIIVMIFMSHSISILR